MIRGAFVLSVGYAMGFITARNSDPLPEVVAANVELKEATTEFIKAMKDILADSWRDAKASNGKTAKDLTPEGVDFLMKRLRDALPYAQVSDDTPIIRGEGGKDVLTMGDLRAPFSVPPTDDETDKITYHRMGESPQ